MSGPPDSVDTLPTVVTGRPLRSTRQNTRRLSTRFTALLSLDDEPQDQLPHTTVHPEIPPISIEPPQHRLSMRIDDDDDNISIASNSSDSYQASRSTSPSSKRPAVASAPSTRPRKCKKNNAAVEVSLEESLMGIAYPAPQGPAVGDATADTAPIHGSLTHRPRGQRATTGCRLWPYMYIYNSNMPQARVSINSSPLKSKPGKEFRHVACRICDDLTDTNADTP
jgi:hypothetical protein